MIRSSKICSSKCCSSKSGSPKPDAFAASLLFMLMFSTLGGAQSPPQSPPVPPLPPATQYLQHGFLPNHTLDRYLQQLQNEFRQADADMNGEISRGRHGHSTPPWVPQAFAPCSR